MRRYRDKVPARVPNADDADRAEQMREAARLVHEYLKALLVNDPSKLVRNLKRNEIEGVAEAALAGFILMRATQRARLEFLTDLYGPEELPPLAI